MAQQQAAGSGAQSMDREQIPDCVLMYACIFTYEKPRVRKEINDYQVNYNAVQNYETSGQLSAGSAQQIQDFVSLNHEDQRAYLDATENNQRVESLMRTLICVITQVSSDPALVRFCLALVNGIIEDSRVRIKFLKSMQKSYNKERQLNVIQHLNQYLNLQTDISKRSERDMAAHTLAQLISATGVDNKNRDEASNFLNYLIQAGQDNRAQTLSMQTFTHCLMYLLKINTLAEEFVQKRGFQILLRMLKKECQEESQIAYNVCSCFWVLTYHDFALSLFQDFKLNVLEHIAKILDFSNKEKVVRMICRIFNNLKNDEVCLEHLSIINALNLVIKYRNRHWVDEEIKTILEQLFDYLNENYLEFSSFDKWKAQVTRRQLCWSPVHTEKFWQTSFIFFNDAENLECINILISILQQKPSPQVDNEALQTMKAVACYDIGEFARFFPMGKEYLEERSTKAYLAELMGDPNSSAELKKQAITSYQKMLMHSWGQHAN